MSKLNELVRTADFKNEKHVPVLDAPAAVAADTYFTITATVGKEIAHPNTTEHHIVWVSLHFIPDGAKVSYEVARCEFSAHGQSAVGPNQGPVHTDSAVTCRMKINTSGTLCANAYCNIHGLWSSEVAIAVK